MNYSKLDRLRKEKKYTQTELAKAVGRSREWYKNVLENKNMTVKDLEGIAKYMGVPESFFFTESYATNNQTNIVNEPNLKRIENMLNLIESQKEIISLLKEKIGRLEERLSEYEEMDKSKEAI